MGHIKEPRGIDFVIASDPLTEKTRQEISAFIQNYKKKTNIEKTKSTTSVKQAKEMLT